MTFLSTATSEAGDEERRLRLHVLLEKYRTILIVAFIVFVALGAWLSYGAYANPGEETTQQREHAWTATGDVAHGVTVTEPNSVYPTGTRLENESLYYTAISPTIDGEFVGGYESRTGDNVTVSLSADLVYRAVEPDGEAVYWSERERVVSTTSEDVKPDENVTAAFAVNVSDVASRIDEIESDLGASPGETEVVLEFNREIEGTIDGEQRSVASSYRAPIHVEEGTYWIESASSYDETYEEYETEVVPASVGPPRTVGGPVLLLIGVGGLGGLAYASRRLPELTAAEREWLSYRDDRDQFEEVITTVALPDAALEGPHANSATLAALAEFAIDVDAAVVFDPDRGLYVVRHNGIVYVFEPPTPASVADSRDNTESGDDEQISFIDASDLASPSEGAASNGGSTSKSDTNSSQPRADDPVMFAGSKTAPDETDDVNSGDRDARIAESESDVANSDDTAGGD